MFRHILVATDGSALSAKGARHAVRLARKLGARVTGLYSETAQVLARSTIPVLVVR